MGYFTSKEGSIEEATRDLTKYINDLAYSNVQKRTRKNW